MYRFLVPMLILGAALRLWLAFSVFLNQGFAWDMATFASWQDTIYEHGYDAYAIDPGINYPSVFAWVLVAINYLGDAIAPIFGVGSDLARYSLQKLPPVIADLAIAWVLTLIGKKWFTPRVGLWAAGLFLFLPAIWYDSAIWGQMDSLAALPMLLAVVMVIDRRPELSALFLVIAVLTKPQGALILVILVPVLIGQLVQKELPVRRLATTFLAGLGGFALLAMPWNFESYVPGEGGTILILGDLLGLAYQYFMTAGLFPVLTANAFNLWALVGQVPLSQQISTGTVYWITDNYQIFGVASGLIGITLFVILCITLSVILISKHDPEIVLTAFALLLVGFFVLPTRVHERYLVQAFAILCLVWATHWYQRVVLTVLSLANAINMHAILAGNLNVKTAVVNDSAMALGGVGPELPNKTLPIVEASPEQYGLSWVRMDVSWAREEWLVTLVSWIHFLAFTVLIVEFWITLRSRAKKKRPAEADPI